MTVIISDEAVNIALNTWLGGIPAWRNDATERLRTEMRAALTAALPFLPVQVAVKKLEWGELRYTEDYSFAQDAETSIGRYIATDNGWFLQGQSGWKSEDDIEAAKAAAQADYEARILSALEPSAARSLALAHLEEIQRAVFGTLGSEPDVYADYDRLCELSRKMREAIRALGTSREQLNKAVSNVPDQQVNEPGAMGERERALEEGDLQELLERLDAGLEYEGWAETDGAPVELFDVEAAQDLFADAAAAIRALSSPDHADAGKVEGDGRQELEQAARNLIANRFDTYQARNGKLCSIEGDDGEKCWIVSFDDMAELEAALPSAPSGGVK